MESFWSIAWDCNLKTNAALQKSNVVLSELYNLYNTIGILG